jgi:hypothetical protein
VIARHQALATGMTRDMLRRRLSTGGPWQHLLPGVYLALTGVPTENQREMAALLYGGPDSVITGNAALRRQGIRVSASDVIDILIPASRKRSDAGFAHVCRTTRMPDPFGVIGAWRYTLPPRAIADAVRGIADLSEVRALVASAVQARKCSLDLLIAELRQGSPRGSAQLRQAVAEVADGIRSTAEGDLRDLIRRGGLPLPMFNPRLYDTSGSLIAVPDAWWPDARVAAEADSREWHLSPQSWQNTMARHARMSRFGILVLHFSPRQIRTQPAEVLLNINDAIAAGRARPRLPIQARTAAT